MAYRGAMRIKCLAQGHTTENSSEARLEPPTNLLIVIREAYPLDHWVLHWDIKWLIFNTDFYYYRFCGTTLPPSLNSVENTMTIVLRADASMAHEGFSATYVALNITTGKLGRSSVFIQYHQQHHIYIYI